MKEDYIKLVSEITGESYDDTALKMQEVKDKYGVTFKQYYANEFYSMSQTQIIDKVRLMKLRQDKRQAHFEYVTEVSGMSKKEILAEIKRINEKGIYKIGIIRYKKWELYKLNDNDLEKRLNLMAQRAEIRAKAQEKLIKIDNHMLSYDALQEEIGQCAAITEEILPEGLINELTEQIASVRPDIADNETTCRETIIDMEVTRVIFGYTFGEYVSFRLFDKTIEERRKFLPNGERMRVLKQINNQEACDLFNNKHQCYLMLKKYFRRRQVCVYSPENFKDFEKFCKFVNVFVKKPVIDSQGRGVEPVYVNRDTDCYALMNSLLEENGPFVAEELIKMHRKMKALNPDSVNTVRMETFYEGSGEPAIAAAFMRIGKAGSFVDNGSAGGIMVSIDISTGKIASEGCDKNGGRYDIHPSTGIKLKGYQLPYWEQAVALAKELATKTPGVKYIGWDLTCNRWGKWIVVEGNTRPQAHQSSLGKGIRKEFFETIKANPNDFK